jgi:outer membrane murein-binding lipoprotein Lpp
MSKQKTAASSEIDTLESKIAALESKLADLPGRQRAPQDVFTAARARVIELDMHRQAGDHVAAEHAAAVKQRTRAAEEAEAAAAHDWAAERQALEGAIRRLRQKHSAAVGAQIVPLIDALGPEATELNQRLTDALDTVQRLCGDHDRLMRRAEAILGHGEWWSRPDIPARPDQFVPLLREVDAVASEGIGWPLPNPGKLPFRLLGQNASTLAGAGWPEEAA